MPDQHLLLSFHFLRKYEADYQDIADVGSSKPKNLRMVVVTRWTVKRFYDRTNPLLAFQVSGKSFQVINWMRAMVFSQTRCETLGSAPREMLSSSCGLVVS